MNDPLTTAGTSRRLLGYLGHYQFVLWAGVLAMMVYAISQAGFAALLKPLMDGTFVERDPYMIRIMPLVIVAIFLVRGVAEFAYTLSMNWVGRRVVKHMRAQLFDKLLALPASYYDNTSSGVLLSKMSYNIEQVAESASKTLVTMIRDSLIVIALVAWLFYLNWLLTLFVFVSGPAIIWLLRVVSRRFRRYSTRIQDSMGEVTQVTEEVIEGHQVIKVFGGQDYERRHFETANEHNRALHMKHSMVRAVSTPVIGLIAGLGIAVVIYVATQPAILDTITVGAFISFLGALLLINPPLKAIINLNVQLQQGLAAAQSVFEMLDEDAEQDTGTVTLARARGDIGFEGIRFAYSPAKGDVLCGIDLEVRAGETIALVGRSGSGKSTLVSLLPRFYEPDAGRITLDGHDIRDIRLADLRAQIALVSQDVSLFNDTVARNIAYGRMEDVGEARVIEAAEAAYAMSFIRELPDGLGTLVGDNGVLLSGGQRQRIAIARALLKDAPILILDEATSALDSESERHIQAALDNLMRARTTLVIAHRLSTIERADRIVVLDGGRVIESGSHAELLAREGTYASLHRLQFSEAAAG